MPPARPFWKGYLKLSLVSCPIALFPASSSSERVSFRQINKKTGHRLKQQLVDSVTGELVESQDKGRGYEIGKKRIQGLDIQGAWTLHLLPRTSGGMWFTLNIGSHAVAFAPRKPINSRFTHYLEHNPIGLNQYRKGRDSQTRSDRRVLPDRMIRGTSDAEGLFPGLA